MRATAILLLLFFLGLEAQSQSYFPPTSGDNWDTLNPESLDWCQENLDSLSQYLLETNTKSFIILKNGRIVVEEYFGTYTQDSLWYWASAGKSLAAFLVGCAQADGFLDINQPSSDFLGQGWTSAPLEKENLITIKDQISMSTGLDDMVPDQDCLDPSCLQYLEDAGDRWAYHNAPYRLVQDVVSEAVGSGINLYTFQRLANPIGMGGAWVNYIRFGKARDMARFGLLMLNDGVWDGNVILGDSDYIEAMKTPSQPHNEAYGYLWWLNGGASFMLPGTQFEYSGELISSAPVDMYAALGLNDQKIYIVPSLDMVVVRQGDSAGDIFLGPSSFDETLWSRIIDLECAPDNLVEQEHFPFALYPNPSADLIQIDGLPAQSFISIFNASGERVMHLSSVRTIDISALSSGLYVVQVHTEQGAWTTRMKVD